MREVTLVGDSPQFMRALELLRRVARCDAPLLLLGETGTGKDMAARFVHYLGSRRDQPFIPVNCGALPDDLLENELFGHRRGAFTDARDNQPGLVEQAEGGTLFLDEVGTLSPKAQVVLLRFIQNQEYRMLGGQGLHRSNVRIIAATNADLEAMAGQGAFRQDLLFRLNIISVAMPSLRERPMDIRPLSEHFLDRFRRQYGESGKRFSTRAMTTMQRYAWPGNIREMENFIHREFLLSDGPELDFHALDVRIQGDCSESAEEGESSVPFSEAKAKAVLAFERQYLERLMAACRGNISLAARRAGKERRALGKLLKKHAIDRARYAPAAK